MTGPTHIAFANACLLAGAALYRWEIPTGVLIAASLGSLLPDIDTPKSLLGRFFWFIASPLEKRVGHRGLTHSLLGLPLYLLLCIPLWWFNPLWAYALLGGVLSHLAIDTLTKQGIQAFWPKPHDIVLFHNDDWRMEVNGLAERLLLIGLILAIGVLIPVSKMGMPQLWAQYVGDLGRAIKQYHELEGERELWLVGKLKDNLTEQKFQGRWRAIGTAGSALLILVDDTVRSVGTGEGHNLRPQHVHLEPGEALETAVATVSLAGQPLASLRSHLPPDGEHWLRGKLTLAAPLSLAPALGRYAVVEASGESLSLDHARWLDLEALSHLLVISGEVLVKHHGPPGMALASDSQATRPPPTVVVPITLELSRLSDLQVQAGDAVAQGQTLATSAQVAQQLSALRRQIAAEKLARLSSVPAGYQQLFREGVIDRREYLAYQTTQAKADAALSQLEAQLAQLDAQQHVTSQLAGTVTSVRLLQQRGNTLSVELLIATPAPKPAPHAQAANVPIRSPARDAERAGSRSEPSRGNTRIADFDAAKDVLPKLFAGHEETLYCGCRYRGKTIDWASCGYRPRQDRERAARLEWEHVVPAAAFGRAFREWQSPPFQCRGEDKRNCLRQLLPSFARMEADLYNLMPAIGEVNGRRSDARMGKLWGERREFGACDVEIRSGTIEPRPSVRGDIARTYFYMAWAYPSRLQLSAKERRLLDAWAAADPPDAWELERARRIETLQGNRNPFVQGGTAGGTG